MAAVLLGIQRSGQSKLSFDLKVKLWWCFFGLNPANNLYSHFRMLASLKA